MAIARLKSGAEIYYEEYWLGQPWLTPEPVLLIHGSSESGRSWFDWLPRMATEFRTFVIDLPGLGKSSPIRDFDWKLENVCSAIADYLDAVDLDSVHVVGAKVGGALTLKFASMYPNRAKSISVLAAPVVYPTFHAPPSTIKDRKWIEDSQKLRLGTAVPKEQFDYWNEMMEGTDQESRNGILSIARTLDLEPELLNIKTPTLVITSDKGTAVPLEIVFQYYNKLPNARLLVIPSRAYHTAAVAPHQCMDSVIPFIKGELY